MRKQAFITEEESRKCRKVAEAFTELYESDGTAVLDAGKYGFVKLQYYNINNGFDCVTTYTDSSELFNSLWEDWLYINLLDQKWKIWDITKLSESCHRKNRQNCWKGKNISLKNAVYKHNFL